MSNKITISLLAASLIANAIIGYYLYQTTNDLKNAEAVNKLHTQEIQKLNQQLNAAEIPEGYEIEEMPLKKPAKNRVINRAYIPSRTAESYVPIRTNWVDTAPFVSNERNSYPANTYDQEMNTYNNGKAAGAAEGIRTELMLDSMFPQTPIIYTYP